MKQLDGKGKDDASGGDLVFPEPQDRDRRRHERAECNGFAEVILDAAAFLFRGSIRDLSSSGCYIQSRARLLLPRGTTVELRLSLAGEELQLPARIMIVRPGAGAGFEFLNISPEMQSRLSSIFHKLIRPLSTTTVAAGDHARKPSEAAAVARETCRS